MAAGKQDSRQKMINMMYLVFIAMLALNISKEVLATLGILNQDIENSIKSKAKKAMSSTGYSLKMLKTQAMPSQMNGLLS